MAKKHTVTPSKESARRARLAAAFHKLSEDKEYFRFDVIRRNVIVFFYAGYRIRFEPYGDSVVRVGLDHRYLSTEDYTVMFDIAKQYFEARRRGDREAMREKALTAKPSADSPAPDTLLFTEKDLPIRRKPKK